jgi:hypothetical protein
MTEKEKSSIISQDIESRFQKIPTDVRIQCVCGETIYPRNIKTHLAGPAHARQMALSRQRCMAGTLTRCELCNFVHLRTADHNNDAVHVQYTLSNMRKTSPYCDGC